MKPSNRLSKRLAPISKSVYSQHVGGLAERLRSGLQIRAAKPRYRVDFHQQIARFPTVKKSRTLHERIVNASTGEIA